MCVGRIVWSQGGWDGRAMTVMEMIGALLSRGWLSVMDEARAHCFSVALGSLVAARLAP